MFYIIFPITFIISTLSWSMEHKDLCIYDEPAVIQSDNIDDIILKGVKNIRDTGELFQARAGNGQQAYDVSYVLTNPLNRVHTLRKPASVRYFCKELLAYFKGSLKVDEGLGQAAPMWKTLADENGNIASNYGYYVFHQKVPEFGDKTQYEWVIAQLSKNLDSRKAFININQPHHKVETSKDYPCTLGMQFFVRKNNLCCAVSSRSTDIYTGLPYDMGFFSFVNELVYKDLKERLGQKAAHVGLGYVVMKTNFTQIYDKTRTQALKMLTTHENKTEEYMHDMPVIHDAQETLKDIYNQTAHTPVMKWINNNAKA